MVKSLDLIGYTTLATVLVKTLVKKGRYVLIRGGESKKREKAHGECNRDSRIRQGVCTGPLPLSQNIRTASPPPALLFSLPPTLPTQHCPIPRCGLFFLVLEPRIRPFRLPALSHARPRLLQLRFLRLTRPHQCTFTILAISLVSIRQTVCDAHPSL